MAYFTCKVAFDEETEHGIKQKVYSYIVMAESVTESEANISAYISKHMPNSSFYLKSSSELKIEAIIRPE